MKAITLAMQSNSWNKAIVYLIFNWAKNTSWTSFEKNVLRLNQTPLTTGKYT